MTMRPRVIKVGVLRVTGADPVPAAAGTLGLVEIAGTPTDPTHPVAATKEYTDAADVALDARLDAIEGLGTLATQAGLSAETTARTNADTAEATARANADTAEATARASADAAEATARANGDAASAPLVLLYHSGFYYTHSPGGMSTQAQTAGRLFAHAMPIGTQRAFDRLAAVVSVAAAASVVRLGVYADAGDGTPGALLFEAGTIDSSTTGVKEITIAQTLPRGVVWLASMAEGGAPTMRVQASGWIWPAGLNALTTGNLTVQGYQISGVAVGALPNPFPAGFLSAVNGILPTALWLRAA